MIRLVERVRESQNGKIRPVGVFVGLVDNSKIYCGWSKCRMPPAPIARDVLDRFRSEEKQKSLQSVRESDCFDLERGVSEAMRNMFDKESPPVHRGFARRFEKFKVRCQRYFKGATIGVNVGQVSKLSKAGKDGPHGFGCRCDRE